MNEFLRRVQNAVNERRLLSHGQQILVAVSGGADSMALLHSLYSLAPKNHWKLVVAHFNHRLRGRASDADEKLVCQTAAGLRLRFFAGGADVKQMAGRAKLSVEMAARKLRHEFLARTARAQKISTVALAHHADDQVELFFLRLLRGAGGEGLAGMKWLAPSPADKNLVLVRPLLGFAKLEILAFARDNQVRFRDDASNFSQDFLRNRIRHELLPLLRKNYQPGLHQTVLRLMEIVGAEAEFVGESARNWERRGTGFEKLPLAVQRKVLQQQLAGFGVMPDFERIEQLRTAPGRWVDVGEGMSIARDPAGKIVRREHPANEFNPAELRLKFQGRSGEAEFGGRKFRWRIQVQKELQLPARNFAGGTPAPPEFFDADRVGGEIVLRHWRAGDRFQPIGLKSAVKLQDLFVNAKMPSVLRRQLILAAAATGEIFWVEGLRISENFKLMQTTKRRLVWRWQGNLP